MPKAQISKIPPGTATRKSSRAKTLTNQALDEVIVEQDEVKPTRSKRAKTVHVGSVVAPEDPKLIPTLPEPQPRIQKTRQNTGLSKRQKGKVKNTLPEHDLAETISEELDTSSQIKSVLKKETPVVENSGIATEDDTSKKTSRKRKTKEEKKAAVMPPAARTVGLKMFVGSHVSISKGLENAVSNALHIGGNAFALFLKNQRRWDNPALKDENRVAFKQLCIDHQYDQSQHVVPHGSYLVNLASPDQDMLKKSYDAFVDDLHRCEVLGIRYYNFHPGSTNKEPLEEAINRLAQNINRALAETKTVIPLLENMAGHGSVIGSRFSDLRDIIDKIKPEYRSRIGICVDTCHAFAAGYDLRSAEAFQKTFAELDRTVGLQYLKAMHLNDSKAPFDSHRDLHQNIGLGFLGLRAFHNVMNEPRLQNIPLILETPGGSPVLDKSDKTDDDRNSWAREIKLLESLIGMDPNGKEFKDLEAELSERGRPEREKMESSIEAKEEKARKKAQRDLEKGQKRISSMLNSSGRKRKRSTTSSSSLSELNSDA